MPHHRIPTCLRRQEALLEWIERKRDTARVIYRSVELGCWGDIRAGWRRCGTYRILRFLTPQGPVERRVSSVRPTRDGACILLAGLTSRAPEVLHLRWGTPEPGVGSQVDAQEIADSFVRHRLLEGRIRSSSRRSDLAHSLSGAFLRMHVIRHDSDFLILAAAPGQDAQKVSAMLTQAMIWSVLLRPRVELRGNRVIVLLVGKDRSLNLCHRVRFLDKTAVPVEVWEYRKEGTTWGFSPAPPPPAPQEHRDYRWPVLGPYRWSRKLADVMDLAAGEIRRYPRFVEYDSLRIRGLEFARVEGSDRSRVMFGVGAERAELTGYNIDSLSRLVEEILYYRRADSPDTRHPFYRLQAERWLESMILDDVARLFPELTPGAVYSQIPVYLGETQGRVDILGADREGTLTVMELKISEDPELPLQALDYWGRVTQHNILGDFQRRGYFSEVRLNRRRPRIYLVSPVFSFHDTTEKVLGYIDHRIEVWKVGVNIDWRCGIRILNRTQVRDGNPERGRTRKIEYD